MGRLSNKPSKRYKNWPMNFQSYPVTHLHPLRPPQNKLRLDCSGSGPGTHQRTKLQFRQTQIILQKNMQLHRLTYTSESLSTSQWSSTQSKPSPECSINFWTNTKNHSNEVPNLKLTSSWPSPKDQEKISGTSLKRYFTKRRSQSQAGRDDSSPLVISITPMANSTFNTIRMKQLNDEISTLEEKTEGILDVMQLHCPQEDSNIRKQKTSQKKGGDKVNSKEK